MKKVFLAIAATALLSFTLTDEWKKVSLSDKIEVAMLGEAKQEGNAQMKGFRSTLADESSFSGVIVDFGAFGLSEDMMPMMLGNDQFKEQMKTGMTAQSGLTILSESDGKYKDKYTYWQYDVEMTKDGKKSTGVMRVVFYKASAIVLNYMGGKNGLNAESKDKFLTSLEIKE